MLPLPAACVRRFHPPPPPTFLPPAILVDVEAGPVRFGTQIDVEDVRAAAAFYERAFGVGTRVMDDGGRYAELEVPGGTFGFVQVRQARSDLHLPFLRPSRGGIPPGIEVGFEVPDLQAAFERAVEAGAEPVAPPEAKPWGRTTAHVLDRHGVLVELSGPLAAAGS